MKLKRSHLLRAAVLVTTVTTAVVAAEPGQKKPREDYGPRIEFAESFYDFGRLPSDKVVSHDFIFTNVGNAVLEITDIQSSCGCTAVTNWNRHVEPGQVGQLHVLFNTGGMAGPVRKSLRVISNDTNLQSAILEFSATVWKWIDAMPTVAAFTFGPDYQTNETRVVRLVSNLDEPVTLSAPECTNRAFTATLETVKPGREFELHIAVNPPLGPGSMAVPITMKTSSPKMPVVSVTAYALVQPALTWTPARIRLPANLAEAKKFAVMIQNNSNIQLVLSAPGINADGIRVELREVQAGKLFELAVTFPADFHISAGQAVEAQVKSNHPQLPLIKVPVLQTQPSTSLNL